MTTSTLPPTREEYIARLLDEHNDPSMTHDRGKNVWNGWPTGLPVVKVEHVTGAHALFDLGQRAAEGVHRSPYYRLMPREVLDMLQVPANGMTHGITPVYWTMQRTPGQTLLKPSGAIVGIMPPEWRWEGSKVPATPRQSGAIVVTVGCDHQGKTETRLSNCYYEHKCPKCGWTYRVDSGD